VPGAVERSAMPTGAFCRKFGLCEQTFYAWKRHVRTKDGVKRPSTPVFAEVSVKRPGTESSAEALLSRFVLGKASGLKYPWEQTPLGWAKCSTAYDLSEP